MFVKFKHSYLQQELPHDISKKTFSIVAECMEKSYDEKGYVCLNI